MGLISNKDVVHVQEHFLGLNGSAGLGFSVMEECCLINKLSQDCSDDDDKICNNEQDINSRNGENPNFRKRETKSCSRGHWKPCEDAKLREVVAVYGPQNWNLIAQKLDGRSGKSCRLRWYNQLDPKINKTAFTQEEEERLVEAHRVYGNKWAFISSRLFPGRTDNSVKNHWHVMRARKYRSHKTTKSSYIKNKWNITSLDQPTLISFQQELLISNSTADSSFAHGNLQYSPAGSPSQISFAAPISTEFMQDQSPKFIDFLGVGTIIKS